MCIKMEVRRLTHNWKFQRGDVYFTRFDPGTGSEQSGNRPAVVIQNDVTYSEDGEDMEILQRMIHDTLRPEYKEAN